MHPIFLGQPATWDLAKGDPIADDLEPADYRLLHLAFAGHPVPEMSQQTGRPVEEIRARMRRPRFLAVQAEIEKGVLQRIIRHGEFEPTTVAKAAAPDAMRRIVAQSERERDPRTRLAANKTVLQFAGIEPPRRLEITTPDRVIEQMTPAELEDLAERRVWPSRFREVLRAFLPAVAALAPKKALDVTPRHQDEDDGPPAPGESTLSQESLEAGLR
jgi:hypothetical protein